MLERAPTVPNMELWAIFGNIEMVSRLGETPLFNKMWRLAQARHQFCSWGQEGTKMALRDNQEKGNTPSTRPQERANGPQDAHKIAILAELDITKGTLYGESALRR